MDLPAAHSAIAGARKRLRTFATREGLKSHEVDTLALVASELLGNAVDHGGGLAAMDESEITNDARMHLAVEVYGGGWRCSVSDQGGGDPAEVERLIREHRADLGDERGRGLYLLVEMVDRVDVRRSADGKGLTISASRRHGDA